MTVRNVTYAQSGHQVYADALRQQRMEQQAARTAEVLRTQQATATVRKRSMGFSIGKFGIDFTSQDVELPKKAPATAPRSSFGDQLDAATILRTANRTAAPSNSQTLSANQTLVRTKALEAYAQASLDSFTTPGHIGSV